ncbi:Carbohydrate esterase 4 protein [Tulasnella sp. JGI-2019a]|nr:Carbohydrate esterase 4 protein [Tulasnella sp. JGI-2019a]
MKPTLSIAVLSVASVALAVGNYAPEELAPILSDCSVEKTWSIFCLTEQVNDGAWVYMYDIGKLLSAAGGKGTFFVNGNNRKCIYKDNGKRIRWLYKHGHQISSLTRDHKSLPSQPLEAMATEMEKPQEAFTKLLGVTSRFLRPPSETSTRTPIVKWSYDAGDSAKNANVKEVIDGFRRQFNKKPHSILASLLETSESTAHQVLPAVIKMARVAGYKFVSVAECLGQPPYNQIMPYPVNITTTYSC